MIKHALLFSFLLLVSCQNEQAPTKNKPITAIDNQNSIEGKRLFRENCASCHMILGDGTGPQLGGITEKRDKKWLHDFTRDNAALIMSGDTAARNIYEAWRRSAMPSYVHLDSSEIENIYMYIEDEYRKK